MKDSSIYIDKYYEKNFIKSHMDKLKLLDIYFLQNNKCLILNSGKAHILFYL